MPIIISHRIRRDGKLTGGSALTQRVANKHRKPCLYIDLNEIDEPKAVQIISSWIDARKIKTLNIAGPQASKDLHIYDATKRILQHVFQPPPNRILAKWPKTVEEAVEKLFSELPLKDKTNIANMPEEDLVKLHPMLGTYIRSRFCLWSGNKELISSCSFVSGKKDIHEDDATGVIIRKVWERLRETHTMRVVE